MMNALTSPLHRLLRRFRVDRRGNVAIIFAIAIIPILGFIGAAIDYGRANAVRVRMQSALDSTALMLSPDAPGLSDVSTNSQPSSLDSKAQAIFNSLFTAADTSGVTVDATYSTSNGTNLKLEASAEVPTTFLDVLGYDDIAVGTSSTAKWGSSRLRVALVLDNTGSMGQDGKMAALKSATKSLLDQLHSAATNDGDVYVSIIPFSKDVNVGSQNYDASWIDWNTWDSENTVSQTTTTCNGNGNGNGNGYGNGNGNGYGNGYGNGGGGGGYNNGGYNNGGYNNGGYNNGGGNDHGDDNHNGGNNGCHTTTTEVPADHNTWNGCIMDRGSSSAPGSTAGYDQTVDPPDPSKPDTLFPADQYSKCPVEMMGLNYNWSTMASLVDSMQPDGNTNQPIGLVWGWQSLVGGGPLTAPAMDSNYQYQQIIILLSDGLNTEDRWYQAQTPVNNRMYQTGNGHGTCANIKAAGITIYTIQVNTGGDPTSTLLQNCASGSGKFYLLTSASGIAGAFNQIGTDITKLRVAK